MSRRTVIITGATKGLGRALALEFARVGDRVIGLYGSDDSAADSLRSEIGGDSSFIKHDISHDDPTIWSRPEIQQAENLVLINNAAAPFSPRPFHLVPLDELQRGLDIALKGSWLAARGVLKPMLRSGGGTIVNILTAALSETPPKGFSAYLAAKHALRGLTLSLAAEYAEKGVRVFSVSPGFMQTSMTANWDARLVDSIRSGGSISDPTEVAKIIRALVEDPSTRGCGENVVV